MLSPPNFYFIQSMVRIFSTNVQKLAKSHYDNLGITPKATQADVKSAYYKLSMQYHPDKNKDGVDASKKFRSITEAYEVLGNVKSRKLYDKGLFLGTGTRTRTHEEHEPVAKFYKSRETRTRPPAPMGRTVIYDFDEWSRNHYAKTLQNDFQRKQYRKAYERGQEQLKNHDKVERVIFGMSVLVLGTLYYFYGSVDHDKYRIIGVGDSFVTIKSKKDDN